MMSKEKEFLISILGYALGLRSEVLLPSELDWEKISMLSTSHGVGALVYDGIQLLYQKSQSELESERSQRFVLGLYSQVVSLETNNLKNKQVSRELIDIWIREGIRTRILKGASIAKYYPNPLHRYSCDFDCFLSDYEGGNKAMENMGIDVNRDYYKNSSFTYKGLYVENHQFCTPVRGNAKMKQFELVLRGLLYNSESEYPSELFNALFLIEHSYAHFFEDALSLKQLCDWCVFKNKCAESVDWERWRIVLTDLGIIKFAYAFDRISEYMAGKLDYNALSDGDILLLDDMLNDNTSVIPNAGWKTRISLIRHSISSRWKYRLYSSDTMIKSLLRTTFAFLFEKTPKL